MPHMHSTEQSHLQHTHSAQSVVPQKQNRESIVQQTHSSESGVSGLGETCNKGRGMDGNGSRESCHEFPSVVLFHRTVMDPMILSRETARTILGGRTAYLGLKCFI